jgi:hypothetical protein
MATKKKAAKKKARAKKGALKPREGRSEERPRRIDHVEIKGGRINGRTLFVRVCHETDGSVRVSLGSSFSKLQLAITGKAAQKLATLAAPVVLS